MNLPGRVFRVVSVMEEMDDLAVETLGRPFPHPVEVLGVLAGVVPFFVHLATIGRWVTEGKIRVTYSDPFTVVAGALAVAAGTVAAIFLPRTARRWKVARTAVVLALLGLGGFQVARGFAMIAPPAELLEALRPDVDIGDEKFRAGDLRAAVAAYGRACDFGDRRGCFNAGQLHANLVQGSAGVVPRDLPKARVAWQMGCDRGHERSCQRLAAMAPKAAVADH